RETRFDVARERLHGALIFGYQRGAQEHLSRVVSGSNRHSNLQGSLLSPVWRREKSRGNSLFPVKNLFLLGEDSRFQRRRRPLLTPFASLRWKPQKRTPLPKPEPQE